MQSKGHTGGRHLPHAEHSSGTIMTSIPWLKMAPNCGGQCRRHVSQLMHSDISMRNGTCFHFGFRTRSEMRSARLAPATTSDYLAGAFAPEAPGQRGVAAADGVAPAPAFSADRAAHRTSRLAPV